MFEIGIVYFKHSQFFLAISETKLITIVKQKVKEIRPYAQGTYDRLRTATVGDLCSRWGIKPSLLDRVSKQYLSPSLDAIQTAPRRSRRQRLEDSYYSRQFKTYKFRNSGKGLK